MLETQEKEKKQTAKSSYVSKISLKILNNMKKDKKDAQSVPQS